MAEDARFAGSLVDIQTRVGYHGSIPGQTEVDASRRKRAFTNHTR